MLDKLLQLLKTTSICILACALTLSIVGCEDEESEGEKLSKLVSSSVGPDDAPIITTPFTIVQVVSGEKQSVELSPSVFPFRFDLDNQSDQHLFVSSVIATIDYVDKDGSFKTAETAFSIGDIDTPDDEDFIPISIIYPYSDEGHSDPDTTAALGPGEEGGFGGIIWFNGMPTPDELGTDFITFNVEVRFVGYFSESSDARDVTTNFTHVNNSFVARASF